MDTKVILVTGASSGIGRGAAIALARQGHVVYGGARRLGKLEELRKYGVVPLELDVTDQDAAGRAVERVIADQGRIDVLLNNAGYGLYGAVEDVPIEETRKQFEVNLFGLARMTSLVLPYMRGRRRGTIVNTSSVGGRLATPLAPWYHASKFAVEGLTDAMRLETREFNIDVVLIEPGLIATDFWRIATDQIRKYSLNGAYASLANAVIATLGKVGGGRGFIRGSQPGVVTRAILKAVNSRRPRTRYLIGGAAKPSLLARRLLPDRVYDRLIVSQLAGGR